MRPLDGKRRVNSARGKVALASRASADWPAFLPGPDSPAAVLDSCRGNLKKVLV